MDKWKEEINVIFAAVPKCFVRTGGEILAQSWKCDDLDLILVSGVIRACSDEFAVWAERCTIYTIHEQVNI